jgi:hypothetical protein
MAAWFACEFRVNGGAGGDWNSHEIRMLFALGAGGGMLG